MSTFETKEQYLKFISAWKSATNAEEAKSKRVVCDHIQYMWRPLPDEEKARLEERGAIFRSSSFRIPNGGHYKEHGWINAEHHIFYNMMRGKDPKRGFSPKSERKLQYPQTPWYGFVSAAYKLECAITNAEFNINVIGQGKIPPRHRSDAVEEFLKPFGGEITEADLLKVDKEALIEARKFHR